MSRSGDHASHLGARRERAVLTSSRNSTRGGRVLRGGATTDKERPNRVLEALYSLWASIQDDLLVLLFATAAGLVRAMGVTIESGQTGLLFRFGRAKRSLAPGFHPLVPFMHKVRRLPTRSRTLDLPAQRVEVEQGLVYHADANLVYRVTDVRKAMIEVDVLERGMLHMLGLGIQEVLRATDHEGIGQSAELNQTLQRNLAERLKHWGVSVERAGFPTITPSPQTLRVTQLAEITAERRLAHAVFRRNAVPSSCGLGLVGTRHFPRSRTRALQRVETQRRRMRRIKKNLKATGWNGAQIKQAGLLQVLRHRFKLRP